MDARHSKLMAAAHLRGIVCKGDEWTFGTEGGVFYLGEFMGDIYDTACLSFLKSERMIANGDFDRLRMKIHVDELEMCEEALRNPDYVDMATNYNTQIGHVDTAERIKRLREIMRTIQSTPHARPNMVVVTGFKDNVDAPQLQGVLERYGQVLSLLIQGDHAYVRFVRVYECARAILLLDGFVDDRPAEERVTDDRPLRVQVAMNSPAKD